MYESRQLQVPAVLLPLFSLLKFWTN